jgi:DNA phosphorothioation-associated putative methyltransferase
MPKRAQGLTAMARTDASRPIKIAVEHGVLRPSSDFFDYGCGRGADVRWLKSSGWRARGWDPVHLPRARRTSSATVAITYVLNVIEDLEERREALVSAWVLAEKVLVVSARLTDERDQAHSRPRSDGWVTSRGTFQKFFEHLELGGFIQNVTGVEPVPAAPGVYYVFREPSEREVFISRRYALRAPAPYQRKCDQSFIENRELLDELIEFFARHGRLPQKQEIASFSEVVRKFGSIARAFRVIEVATDRDEWVALSGRRRVDLLVYLALKLIDGPFRMNDLPPASQFDVRSHFGSLKSALPLAQRLLFGVGKLSNIDLACRSSIVGKVTPSALYVHVDAYEHLPAILKVYEGCARRLLGDVPQATIIKLGRSEKKVSYLRYPTFDTEDHPGLDGSDVIDLASTSHRVLKYRKGDTQPILHRKELFIHKSDSRAASFAAVTRSEEQLGLYSATSLIGTRGGWNQVVEEAQMRRRELMKEDELLVKRD